MTDAKKASKEEAKKMSPPFQKQEEPRPSFGVVKNQEKSMMPQLTQKSPDSNPMSDEEEEKKVEHKE